jgi:hypothetical protein
MQSKNANRFTGKEPQRPSSAKPMALFNEQKARPHRLLRNSLRDRVGGVKDGFFRRSSVDKKVAHGAAMGASGIKNIKPRQGDRVSERQPQPRQSKSRILSALQPDSEVAVGTTIADRPPHRSVRALISAHGSYRGC